MKSKIHEHLSKIYSIVSKNLFYILVLFASVANAQIVNIPDANFKAKLIALGVDTNSDGQIQTSEALVTTGLDVYQSNISNMTGIESFTNLQSLNCSNNSIASLDVSNLTSLYTLSCNNNLLTSLNVTGANSLQILNCYNNSLTVLDVSNLQSLTNFSCDNNPNLTSLNVTGDINLRIMTCDNGQLTTLDLSNLTALQSVNCSFNQLTEILLANNISMFDLTCTNNLLTEFNVNGDNVQNLDISYNPITSIDVSSATRLYILYIAGVPLEFINIKNGRNVFIAFAGPISNLQHVCCEEQFINVIRNNVVAMGYPNTVVSSYCTFTPGGNHNTINGTVTFDANNNGCDSNDIFQPNIRVNINDGTNSGATFTANNGNYEFYTLTGNFTIAPSIENPTWYNFSPASADIPFVDSNNNSITQNFCLAANGIHPDVEVVIAPMGAARPGFDSAYKVVLKNKGNQTLSGNVTFVYDDTVSDFVSSDVTLTSQSAGLLGYDYTNLLPFENRSFYITLHLNSPTDTPAVNIGDQLNFTAVVNPIAGDENPSDNTFQYNQTVVGSLDPNDITCIEGNIVSPAEIGNYLHYVINFENTGTSDAENVVVRDVIDVNQFDINSLQLMNSSAPVTARLTGNVAEFIFQNINLHSGGHGNILIKVKSKNTLVQGDTVSKKASIYFDYNAPVDTNLENTIFQALSNPDIAIDASISVYPNPTKGQININCNNNIQSVQLFDVQGRLLQTDLINQSSTVIDISTKANGVYFLKVTSEKGIVVQKIVKE